MFVDFGKASWIWTTDNHTCDQKVVFRRTFSVSEIPEKAITYIACETKFWMWVNGVLVVYEGGVFRESRPGCGYAEAVDLSPYLRVGANQLALLVWFYGNGGRNNVNSGEAGLIISCPTLALFSDETFQVCPHPAYQPTKAPYPSYLYGGHNIGFVADLDFGDFTAADFDDTGFVSATVYPNRVWGKSLLSPLPLLKVYDTVTLSPIPTETGAEAALPYAMAASFGFVLDAEGGETVDIRTDRYIVNGGPGDPSAYHGHRIEYIAKSGRNTFRCPMYLYGEKVILSFPSSVRLLELSYTESGYDTALVGSFVTDDPLFNRLIEKCLRTLYVCMRNNFMDCPDRERGQWIGDVSIQTPQVFFACDPKGRLLLKKAICDYFHLRRGDVLVGNVPGENFSELPSQSLVTISEFGLVGEYYRYTHDTEVLELAFLPIISYLKLWQIGKDGRLLPREGDWRWFDHLHNIDDTVLEHGLYLSALRYARKIADLLNHHEFDDFLEERISLIQTCMESFWKGEYYASGSFADDRANAIAVLCGTCPKERHEAVKQVLMTVQHATPYMERFVLMALCEMGYVKEAYVRMMSRYYPLIVNENSTLWEDFSVLGTRNHAWSGAPLEIAFRYFLGLRTEDAFETFTVSPVSGIFKSIHAVFQPKGTTVSLDFVDKDGIMHRSEA